MEWLVETIKGEAIALYGLIVGGAALLVAVVFGRVFGGVGDKLFKKEKE